MKPRLRGRVIYPESSSHSGGAVVGTQASSPGPVARRPSCGDLSASLFLRALKPSAWLRALTWLDGAVAACGHLPSPHPGELPREDGRCRSPSGSLWEVLGRCLKAAGDSCTPDPPSATSSPQLAVRREFGDSEKTVTQVLEEKYP